MKNCYYFTSIFLFLSLFLCKPVDSHAQDPTFTQFFASPLQMNPALTGVFAEEYRLVANYRTQTYAVLGNQAYKTYAASFEWKRPSGRDDYFSLGLAAMKDQVGESKFSRSRAVLSGSYLKHLGGGRYSSSDQYLVAGAQAGIGQWSYDYNRLWFSEQFFVDPGNQQAYVNYNTANGENFNIMETDMFVEFNAGIMYYNVIDEDNSFYLGGAMHHLTEPNVSFTENSAETLHRRWVGQIGGQFSLSREVSLLPAATVMGQGPSMQTIGGLALRYSNRDWREVAIRFGGWARMVNELEQGMSLDAIAVSAILEMERVQIGVSYDITTSSLSEANNGRGAFELSLIYVAPEKSRYKTICPKF